jgi:NADH/NAD ratio-sensing transcriptional regulator Rex
MASDRAPEPTVLRLSRYHCFLGELMGVRATRRVTSRELAEELGLSEETVRHDLKYVDIEGRPGAGYEMHALYEALQTYLDLTPGHPVAIVGNADIARGLLVTFPAERYGLSVAAYLSERVEDAGQQIGDLTMSELSIAEEIVRSTGVAVALVAVAPEQLETVLDSLAAAGIRGALLLTPALRTYRPEGMDVTYFRIPCALKSLASAHSGPAAAEGSCCP